MVNDRKLHAICSILNLAIRLHKQNHIIILSYTLGKLLRQFGHLAQSLKYLPISYFFKSEFTFL